MLIISVFIAGLESPSEDLPDTDEQDDSHTTEMELKELSVSVFALERLRWMLREHTNGLKTLSKKGEACQTVLARSDLNCRSCWQSRKCLPTPCIPTLSAYF